MPLNVFKNWNEEQWGNIEDIRNFEDKTQIKLREGVKKVLDCLKDHKRETYDDVISKLITEHGLINKDIPIEILKNINERIEDVNQGRVYSVKEAKKRVFDDGDKL